MANKLGREWLEKPQAIVQTAFGRMEVLYQGTDQVKVSTRRMGARPALLDHEQDGMTYRGRAFFVEMVLELVAGQWIVWRARSEDGRTIYERDGTWGFVCKNPGFGGGDAPRTFAAAIKTEVLRAVREHLALDSVRPLLERAEQAELNNQAYRLEDEVAKEAAALAVKRTDLQGILHGLDLISRRITAAARNA